MRVLIAVEDKIYGEAIADFVIKHNWGPSTEFKILHVNQIDECSTVWLDPLYASTAKDLMDEMDRRDRTLVKSIGTRLVIALGNVPISEEVHLGRPKDVILNTAEEWKADMIILGSHGRASFSRFLLGSVSLSVLSHAPCSVVIVKLPKESEHHKTQTIEKVEAAPIGKRTAASAR